MLKLQLTRSDSYDDEYLELPATPADVSEVLSWLDETGSDVASTRIVGAISDVWNIGRYLKTADVCNPEQIKKLNQIAEIVNSLENREQCLIFEGALDAESVNNLDDVIAIGKRLENYIRVPEVTNDRELGTYLVEYGVKSFDESVLPYLHYGKIGSEYYADHGGAYISCGYVLRRDSAEQSLLDSIQLNNAQELTGMNMG